MIRFCFVLSVSGGFSFLFFNGILSTGQRFDVVTFSGKILCDAANLGDSLVGRRRRRGGEGACRVFSQILRSFHPENARGRHAGCWNVFEKITRRNNKESKFTRRLSPQPPAAAEVRRFLKFRAFTHYLVLPSFSLSLRGSFTTKKKPPNQPPFFVFNHSFIDSNRTREGIGIDDAVFWCFFWATGTTAKTASSSTRIPTTFSICGARRCSKTRSACWRTKDARYRVLFLCSYRFLLLLLSPTSLNRTARPLGVVRFVISCLAECCATVLSVWRVGFGSVCADFQRLVPCSYLFFLVERFKTGCCLSCTGFYLVLLGFTGFYRVLPSFTGFYWVLLGFYWVLPSLGGVSDRFCNSLI